MTDPPNLLSPQPPRSQWRVSIERALQRYSVYDRIERDYWDAVIGAVRQFGIEHPDERAGLHVWASAVHQGET